MQRKEEAGLICCRVLPAQGGVTSFPFQYVRPMKGYLAEKQKSSSLSKQDIFKNKAVAKACYFYRYTFCLRQHEKWDLNQLAHVHSVSMVIVSLIPRAKPS